MRETTAGLRKRLKAIEEKIRETEARLPAHSVKPPIMHELLDLEDERDRILDALKNAKCTPPDDSGSD